LHTVRPHSSLGNKRLAEARLVLEQFESFAREALAQTKTEEYKTRSRKLSL